MSKSEGNTIPRARRWCFTVNNFTPDILSQISHRFSTEKYIIGKEVGEKGTPHLQGYVEFKNQVLFSTLKKLCDSAHWEKAIGDRDSNIKYCSKGKDFETNIEIEEPIEIITELYPWQAEVEKLVQTKPDKRKIFWYWDEKGCSGKTELIKYLCIKYDRCIFSTATKSADIVTIADRSKNIYLLNFVRSQEGFAPYGAIEQLKDGLISDSKLKKVSRNIIMNSPHVICFANWEPDFNALSKDRWQIIRLDESSEKSNDCFPF